MPHASELLDHSNTLIDAGAGSRVNRITHLLTVVEDDLAVVESFSHVWIVRTSEGLVLFDASGVPAAPKVIEAIRAWTTDPIHTLVVTHGHMDHYGGVNAMLADASARGHQRPRVVAHRNVAKRLARYRLTDGYNRTINQRQFRPGLRLGMGIRDGGSFVPEGTPDPDLDFDDTLMLEVGGEQFVLRHDLGETDDHAWTEWVGRKTVFVGDFVIWNFPNCGNPQKVLRYPAEWAAALRKMIASGAELVSPAHGLPVAESSRVERVLGTTATALEGLVNGVIDLLNQDASLDDALHTVHVPAELLALPWLAPFYDEPEFVVRNIWRTYGGWWDRNPAHLHPAPEARVAAEVVALAGGVGPLIERADALFAEGDFRTAGELIEWATRVEPSSTAAHDVRARLYEQRRKSATSLMAKGIYQAVAHESADVVGEYPGGAPELRPPLNL